MLSLVLLYELPDRQFQAVCLAVHVCTGIRRCLMVSLPLHGENRALNGDNIVAFQNIYVSINTYMGVMYTCMGFMYLCIATRNWYVFLFGATLKAC